MRVFLKHVVTLHLFQATICFFCLHHTVMLSESYTLCGQFQLVGKWLYSKDFFHAYHLSAGTSAKIIYFQNVREGVQKVAFCDKLKCNSLQRLEVFLRRVIALHLFQATILNFLPSPCCYVKRSIPFCGPFQVVGKNQSLLQLSDIQHQKWSEIHREHFLGRLIAFSFKATKFSFWFVICVFFVPTNLCVHFKKVKIKNPFEFCSCKKKQFSFLICDLWFFSRNTFRSIHVLFLLINYCVHSQKMKNQNKKSFWILVCSIHVLFWAH